jgi:hypothetical protein
MSTTERLRRDTVSDVDVAQGKRTGRPPKDESEKRVPLSLRIHPHLRNELEAAAKEENRSLTQLSQFALTSFLEARKLGHAGQEGSWASSLPSTPEKPDARPARPARLLKQPIDAFGRAFGRDQTALMLAIGCLVKGIVYWGSKGRNIVQTEWWSDPQIFREVTKSISTLLQLFGPDEHPAMVAGVGKALWGPESEKAPEDCLNVACLAMEIALPEYELTEWTEAWGPVIRDWLGEAVIARIRQRISAPSEDQGP